MGTTTQGPPYAPQSSYDSLCNPRPGDVGRPIYVAYGGPCVVVPIRSNDACDVCQRIFRPVCASDGKTYSNQCNLNQSSYDSLCNPRPGDVGRPIYVAYGGLCVVVPIRSNDACDVCQRIFR